MDVSPATLVLALVSLSAGMAGCSTAPAQMKLAPELSGVESWDIRGHRDNTQPLQFGHWLVTSPATFITSTASIGGSNPIGMSAGPDVVIISDSMLTTDLTKYNFVLESQADRRRTWSADCFARFRLVSTPLQTRYLYYQATFAQPGYPQLGCKFSGVRRGELAVHLSFFTRHDVGFAKLGDRQWEIRSVDVVGNGKLHWMRFGYEFTRAGQVVAAVESILDGQVWMDPDLSPPEEDEIALVMTALLYYTRLLESR